MKGRPPKSNIRKRIAAILQHLNASYGYDIYKNYKKVFGPVKMRTVYYNLRKGVMLNEFMINDIKREVGNYTWGNETERVYYSNGPYAEPSILDEAQKIRLQKLERNNTEINKEEQILKVFEEIKNEIETYAKDFKNYSINSRKKNYENISHKIRRAKAWIREAEKTKQLEEFEKELRNYQY